MLPMVMFSGEIADAKVVLHKERRRRRNKQKQNESCFPKDNFEREKSFQNLKCPLHISGGAFKRFFVNKTED